MKKIVLALFIGFLTLGSFAQDLTFPNWKDTVHGTSDDWTIDSHQMDVINTSGQSLTLMVEKNIVTSVGNTEYYFCWGTACEGSADTLSSQSVTIAAGDTNSSFINYCLIKSDAANEGVSKIEYCFFESGGSVNVCVDQYFDVAHVSSVQDVKIAKEEFKIIPGNGLMTILIENHFDDFDIQLYDMSGRLVVQQKAVSTNSALISTQGLDSGSYIVKLSSENAVIGSKKILLVQ